ncbi:MAG: hypothetical protein NT041_02340, partial [Candidatus Vogelbacteria bacterium]|nr:hypothetical protein [Candidatus Vogelbacteria bacterium]
MAKNNGKMPDFKQGKVIGQFGNQLFLAVLILAVIVFAYATLADNGSKTKIEVIPLSEVAQLINQDKVAKISVQSEDLQITLVDKTTKQAKKEVESSLSQSLVNYGVPAEKLKKVVIEVSNSYGTSFWLITVLPILVPIIFVLILFWFISRQVKGASMQAFTFGQSKARLINPDDPKQRVTFKDVAGVKEAKEELLEIVDFLR